MKIVVEGLSEIKSLFALGCSRGTIYGIYIKFVLPGLKRIICTFR